MTDRVNLGCGDDIRPGYVNVDIRDMPGVDVVHDLRERPWPFSDGAFEYALMDNVLEHLPIQPSLEELHRIVADGGTVEVAGPHWNSSGAWAEPTHTRPFTPRTFDLFERYTDGERFAIQRVEYDRIRWGRLLPERLAVALADTLGEGVAGFRVHAQVMMT